MEKENSAILSVMGLDKSVSLVPHRRQVVVGFLFLAGILGLSLTSRTQFLPLFLFYSLAFLCYLYAVRHVSGRVLFFWIAIAVLARCVLIFATPLLSDDVYRFVWDGLLSLEGTSPFTTTPQNYLEGETLTATQETVFRELNSTAYHTVYPPLTQLMFYVSAFLSPENIRSMVLIQKLILCMFEFGSIWLLYQFVRKTGLQPRYMVLYMLNPLVVIELTGNLHHEGIVVFFMLLAFFLMAMKNIRVSGLAIGAAVSTKLLPLIFLPFFVKFVRPRFRIGFILASVLSICFLLLVPLYLLEASDGILASLDLYYRKFEFNAGIYYLIRWLSIAVTGYNQIAIMGPVMAGLSALIILLLLIRTKPDDIASLAKICAIAFTAYLLLSTTIHPWYIIPLVALASLSGLRYPVAWSYLAFLSYAGYSETGYTEVPVWIAIEYLILAIVLIHEFVMKRKTW